MLFFSFACSHHHYPQRIAKNEGSFTLFGKIDGLDSGVLYLQHADTTRHTIFDMPELDSANLRIQPPWYVPNHGVLSLIATLISDHRDFA